MVAKTPILFLLVLSSMSFAQDVAIQDGLAVGELPRARRSPVHVDPVEALLVAGSWRTPRGRGPAARSRAWGSCRAPARGACV